MQQCTTSSCKDVDIYIYVSLHMKLFGNFQLKIKYALDSNSSEVNTCMLYHYHKYQDSCTVICCAYNTKCLCYILMYIHGTLC